MYTAILGVNRAPVLLFCGLLERNRPVNQVQVQVVCLQVGERFLDGFSDISSLVVGIPQLRSQEYLATRDSRSFNASTDLLLVVVGRCGVDVAVAVFEGVLYSFGDLVGLRLLLCVSL